MKETDDSDQISLVDVQFAMHHLSEAIEELAYLQSVICFPGRLSDETLGNHLAHAYLHLNWFWNGRRRENKGVVELNEQEFREFSTFPADLRVRVDKPREQE